MHGTISCNVSKVALKIPFPSSSVRLENPSLRGGGGGGRERLANPGTCQTGDFLV